MNFIVLTLLTICLQLCGGTGKPDRALEFKSATYVLLERPQVCLASHFWHTYKSPDTSERTAWHRKNTIIMAEKPTIDCVPVEQQSEIVKRTFVISHDFKYIIRDRIEAAILESMYLVQEGIGVMERSNSLSSSFLRYFPANDAHVVRKVLLQLSTELGVMQEEDYHSNNIMTATRKVNANLLPIVPGNLGPSVQAYMAHTNYDKNQHMGICADLERRPTLTDCACSDFGDTLTRDDPFEATPVKTILHELMHWNLYEDWLPSRLSDDDPIYGDLLRGYGQRRIIDIPVLLPENPVKRMVTAYGPWAAQQLRRSQPHLAIYNADNYVHFLGEKLLQRRCDRPEGFQDTSYRSEHYVGKDNIENPWFRFVLLLILSLDLLTIITVCINIRRRGSIFSQQYQ